MGFLDRVKAALKREKADLDEAVGEFVTKGNATLDRKERELHGTPMEKLELERQKSQQIDDDMDAIRKRIEGGS